MDDYDVVADALQKHRDRLWDMINRNMSSEYVGLGVMDDIRFYQIDQLDAAIAAHKNKKERQGLTDKPTKIFGPNLEEVLNSAGFYRKKEWQGLTREELAEIAEFHFHGALSGREFYDDIETRLKEKNK